MFNLDVMECCRLMNKSTERLITNLFNQWEREYTPDQLAGSVVRNICMDVQWASARDLCIKFSCRVPTEFLIWLQEQAWVIETYFPNGLSGPNRDASMGEFKKRLPYDLNKFEFTNIETGVSHLSHKYLKPVHVWHYVQLLHIIIHDIPCYVSTSEGDYAPDILGKVNVKELTEVGILITMHIAFERLPRNGCVHS